MHGERSANFRIAVLLIAMLFLLFLGSLLRYSNIVPHNIYPDAFQNLLVAENLVNNKQVIGTLGENGYFYPPFAAWTRPGYSFLIAFFAKYFISAELAAHTISFVLSVLAIPLAYLLAYILFSSKKAGIFAAALLAVSFNHTVWSGFILSEASAIFVSLLFLIMFFYVQRRPGSLGDPPELFTGVIFSLAVFTRYEYLLIAVPATIILTANNSHKFRLLNIGAGFVFASTLILTAFFPFKSLFVTIVGQNLRIIVPFSAGLLLIDILNRNGLIDFVMPIVRSKVTRIILGVLGLAAVIFYLTGLRDFFLTDFFISFSALAGIVLMRKNRVYRDKIIFFSASIFLLTVVYAQINPTMLRYGTHLIPFLLIPASFGLYKADMLLSERAKYLRSLYYAVLILLFSSQLYVTSKGVDILGQPELRTEGYKQQSAALLIERLEVDKLDTDMLVASMPEPYYFYSRIPTQSISDTPPFIYFDAPEDTKLVIVNDMGMRDFFPVFSLFLTENLSEFKVGEYIVGKDYLSGSKITSETHPVEVYLLNYGELKQIVIPYSY